MASKVLRNNSIVMVHLFRRNRLFCTTDLRARKKITQPRQETPRVEQQQLKRTTNTLKVPPIHYPGIVTDDSNDWNDVPTVVKIQPRSSDDDDDDDTSDISIDMAFHYRPPLPVQSKGWGDVMEWPSDEESVYSTRSKVPSPNIMSGTIAWNLESEDDRDDDSFLNASRVARISSSSGSSYEYFGLESNEAQNDSCSTSQISM